MKIHYYIDNYIGDFHNYCYPINGIIAMDLCISSGEWISGAVCMYVANYLMENFGKDIQVNSSRENLINEL